MGVSLVGPFGTADASVDDEGGSGPDGGIVSVEIDPSRRRLRGFRARVRGVTRPSRRAGTSLLVWTLLVTAACDGAERSAPDAASDPSPAAEVVAVVDGEAITRTQLDVPLRIELHDLEIAAWKARRQRLERMVDRRLGSTPPPPTSEAWSRRVDWRLARPEAPRFELDTVGAAILGRPQAPVVVTVFVDFASTHVRALQPALTRLRDRYGDALALAFRQLPLPYHRFALPAALAARCADRQGRYGDYAEALFRVGPDFTPEDLSVEAARIGLDPVVFEACRRASETRAEVEADLALAAGLGVHRTPTVFVNGLYLSDRPGFGAIDASVRSELARLGESMSASRGSSEPERDGQIAAAADSPLPEIPPEALSEPELVLSLRRSEVAAALAERELLEARLEPTRGEFSGQRLLKIRDVSAGDFYSRLGLRPGDVLLAVNGAFVTLDHDHFLDAFAEGDVVRLLVMRRGRPHTWEYRIR